MSKPLLLTLHPRLEDTNLSPEDIRQGRWTELRMGRRKRLTDAELAAEYYAHDSRCRHEQWIETVRGDDDYEDWERAMQSRMYERLSILHRFATLPHYDEVSP